MNRDPELLHPSIETPLPLAPGTLAPDFTLHSAPDESVSLRDFRGQPVLLVFYAADWSPVSSDELTRYHELMPEISRLKAELLGISMESGPTLRSLSIDSSNSRCSLTLSQKERLPVPMVFFALAREPALMRSS